MKNNIKSILVFLFLYMGLEWMYAQTLTPEFQFTLRISDAAARKDSVVIGYDPLATDDMDTAFGEVGYSEITNPFDSLFEARIGYDNGFGGWNYTKRSVVYKQNAACVSNSGWTMAVPIVVRVKNGAFPIQISYNSSLFTGSSCHDSTTLTPFPYHYPNSKKADVYFNLGSAGGTILIQKYYAAYGPYYGYIDSLNAHIYTSSGGTMWGSAYVIFVYISTYDYINQLVLGIKDHQLPQLESKVYPNPASGTTHITVAEPAWCTITDISGKIVERTYLQAGRNTLEVSNYSKGLYYLRLESQNQRQSVHKLVVE